MIQQLPAPDFVLIDGHGALEPVIRSLWPETKIQRCHFHIRQNIHKHLTRKPRTIADQLQLTFVKALKKITDLQQATKWEEQFFAWRTMHEPTINARTYVKENTDPRPSHVAPNQTRWYTYLRLRRSASLFSVLIKNKQSFTYLQRAAEDDVLLRTTSTLEGGFNADIKDHLRLHRGLRVKPAIALVSWHLYQCVENPKDPWSFVEAKRWSTKRVRNAVVDEGAGPELYG